MHLDLSLLGWLHTLACFAALGLGGANLLMRKATPLHRRVGQAYLCTLIFVCATSLGIYRHHMFFFPHYLAILTIILAAMSYAFAHVRRPARLWLRGHIAATVLSYYMLVGGGVNEVYLRVDVLRRLSGGFPSPMITKTHGILMGLTLLALIWFNVTARRRGGSARPVLNG
jgi:uncharacterized membrane protein